MSEEEIMKFLSCDDCKFATCEQCEINQTTKKAIKEYIEGLKKQNKQINANFIDTWNTLHSLSYLNDILPKQVIRDKIKELEEDKQTILQAIEEAKESKDEEFLKYNREILYRINGEISVLKSIIGE